MLDEIDLMVSHGVKPSFDVCSLPDAYFHVSSPKELKETIEATLPLYGKECSLNWIDVSGIDDMSNLFKLSEKSMQCLQEQDDDRFIQEVVTVHNI